MRTSPQPGFLESLPSQPFAPEASLKLDPNQKLKAGLFWVPPNFALGNAGQIELRRIAGKELSKAP